MKSYPIKKDLFSRTNLAEINYDTFIIVRSYIYLFAGFSICFIGGLFALVVGILFFALGLWGVLETRKPQFYVDHLKIMERQLLGRDKIILWKDIISIHYDDSFRTFKYNYDYLVMKSEAETFYVPLIPKNIKDNSILILVIEKCTKFNKKKMRFPNTSEK